LLLMSGADGTDVDQLQWMLQTGGAGSKPKMKSWTASLQKLVKNLTAKVSESHTADKTLLGTERTRLFNACRGPNASTTSGVNSASVVKKREDYDAQVKADTDCKKKLFTKQQEEKLCTGVVAAYKKSKKAVCKNVEATKDPATGVCKLLPTMKTRKDWLTAMQIHFEKTVETLDGEEKQCEKVKTNLTREEPLCNAKISATKTKKGQCDTAAADVTRKKCVFIGGVGNMCVEYDSCYKAAIKSYEEFTNATAQRVISRKLQWRMLKRLECLVGAYDAKKGIDKDKLKACAAKAKYDTSNLNMVYPTIPKKAECKVALPHGMKDTCGSNLPTKAPPAKQQVLEEKAERELKKLPKIMQVKATKKFLKAKCGNYQKFKDFNVKGAEEKGSSDLKLCTETGDIRADEEKTQKCLTECCDAVECVGLVFHPKGTMLKKEWSNPYHRPGFDTYKLMRDKK